MPLRNKTVLAVFLVCTLATIPHLFAPDADYFRIQRAFLTISRCILGVVEFAAFSALSMAAIQSELTMFLTMAAIGLAAGVAIDVMWRDEEDTRVALIFLLAFNLIFGIVAAYSSAMLVDQPTTCTRPVDEKQIIKIVTYEETGRSRFSNYFLLVSDDSSRGWEQISYERKDFHSASPCDDLEVIFAEVLRERGWQRLSETP
jgi:hypothetical protein